MSSTWNTDDDPINDDEGRRPHPRLQNLIALLKKAAIPIGIVLLIVIGVVVFIKLKG